jgi:hypothetical protein
MKLFHQLSKITLKLLLNALSLGIINLTSLSRNIMSELESEFGKEVKQGAVVMSLKDLLKNWILD